MPSRGQPIWVTFTAWDNINNVGKQNDAANFTLRWVKDGTSAVPTNVPATEVDSTNSPGLYKILTTASESTCDFGTICGKSSTSGVSIIPTSVGFEQLPTAVPGATGGVFIAGTNAATTITTSLTTHLVGTVDTVTTLTGYTTPPTAAAIAALVAAGSVASVVGAVGSVTGNVGGSVASVTGNVGGNVVGSVASVTAGVTLSLTQVLSAARALDSIADTSLTLNDAMHCAIASAAGKQTVVGTAYTVETPSTGTVLRTFTLDAAVDPTSRT